MARAANGQMRLRVKKEDLIAAVTAHDVKCQEEYEQAVKAWRLADSQWGAKVSHYLREYAKSLKADERELAEFTRRVSNRYNAAIDHYFPDFPKPPTKPQKPIGAKRLVEMLKLTNQATVALTEDQYSMYFESCAL